MNWLRDIEFEDLLDKDAQLIYQHCGLDVLCALWQNLPGITLYLGEKSLFEIKRRYIRKHHNGSNVKQLAAQLSVSERFVYEAISMTDAADDRQGSLL
jgi:Mor family transcriptional regulator